MAINQAFPSLNDVEPSWADIKVTAMISGSPGGPLSEVPILRMADIAAIKWGRKVELGEKRGASGGRVMARTTGQGSQEASWTLYRSGMRNLITNLASVAPRRGRQRVIGLVGFTIVVQHTPPGDTGIYTVKIKGCRYTGDDDDMKEGTEPDKIEIALNPIEIANVIDGEEIVLL